MYVALLQNDDLFGELQRDVEQKRGNALKLTESATSSSRQFQARPSPSRRARSAFKRSAATWRVSEQMDNAKLGQIELLRRLKMKTERMEQELS